MLATLVVVAVIFGFWLLYNFRMMLFSLFVGIVIGTAVKPVVGWLHRRGLPPMFGAILVYLVLLVLLIAFAMLLVPLIVDQATNIFELLPEYYMRLRELLVSSRTMMLWRLGLQLPPELPGLTGAPTAEAAAEQSQDAETTLGTVVQMIGYASLAGWSIFITIATFLFAFYWTLQGSQAIRTLLLLLSPDQRPGAQTIVEQIEAKVGAYIRGQSILCLSIGVLSFIAYLLVGLPYALVLALIAGVLEAIPYLGPTLAAVPALLLAFSSDPSKVMWVVVAVVVIQQLENNLLVPRVMDASVGVNPVVTLLSIAAFGALFGIPGAILAIPIAAIIQLLLDRFVLGPEAMDPEAPKGRDTVSVLRYETQQLIQDLRKQIRQKDKELIADESVDQVEENIEAIAAMLDSVLAAEAGEGEDDGA
jgi:predicted PurR-regulated permease PerM